METLPNQPCGWSPAETLSLRRWQLDWVELWMRNCTDLKKRENHCKSPALQWKLSKISFCSSDLHRKQLLFGEIPWFVLLQYKNTSFQTLQLHLDLAAAGAGRPQLGPAWQSWPQLSSPQAGPLSPSLTTTKTFTLKSAVENKQQHKNCRASSVFL